MFDAAFQRGLCQKRIRTFCRIAAVVAAVAADVGVAAAVVVNQTRGCLKQRRMKWSDREGVSFNNHAGIVVLSNRQASLVAVVVVVSESRMIVCIVGKVQPF